MSRVLAQLMGVAEPALRTQIMQLEKAAGLPGADIRLVMEVVGQTRTKMRELGLDPHDTTGQELYAALRVRLQDDEVRLRTALGLAENATAADVLEAATKRLSALPLQMDTFAVKPSVMRALIKKLQPKNTMKRLGYRSMESMLKHEPAAQLLAAVSIAESRDWNRRRLEAYKKLKSSDFETRPASFVMANSKQWPAIAAQVTNDRKHNLLSIPELGSVVVLPLERDLSGLAVTTFLLAVDCINDMRSLGSYLKLQQVRPDFGSVFAAAMQHEPMSPAELAGEPLPWKLIHWFYGQGHTPYHPEAFEPHVQPDDLVWHHAEKVLAEQYPALEFWTGSQMLALLDGPHPVSFNMLDVALSVCNDLDYANRIVHHMRLGLGRELMARYLNHDNLQAMLLGKLDEQLAPELSFGN